MTANVGSSDRITRIIVGLLLVDLALAGVVGAWGWIGLLPLISGMVAWCPFYLPRRHSTFRPESADTTPAELREALALDGHGGERHRR